VKEGFTQQRCPRCGGNVFVYRDLHGWYEQCLQCSRIWHLDNVIESRDKVGVAGREEAERMKISSRPNN
jgi:hypothetical protein